MEGTEFVGPKHLLESRWGGEKFSSGEADRGGREFPLLQTLPSSLCTGAFRARGLRNHPRSRMPGVFTLGQGPLISIPM